MCDVSLRCADSSRHVNRADPRPKQSGFGSSSWFIDEGPGCTTKRLPSLTPTTTVSSPWNLGRNRSPRTISAWFRGRKRHSTFMLHSAGTSAIAQIQGGGRMLLLSAEGREMLLGRPGGGPDVSVQNERRAVRTDSVLLRREDCGEAGRVFSSSSFFFILTGWDGLQSVSAQLAGVFLSQWGGLN